MKLGTLSLANFKNIEQAQLEFSPKLNCLLGANGMGKSNLLDAIYLLSYTRSFSGLPDSRLIRRDADFCTLRAVYNRRGVDEEITVGMAPGRRKSLKRSGKEYKRLSDHIGLFPLILVSPADQMLTSGEPAERRRFLDQIATLTVSGYQAAATRYTEAVEQRNCLLKNEILPPADLFQALEFQIEMVAGQLVEARAACVERLMPYFVEFYGKITGQSEKPEIIYRPSFDTRSASLAEKLEACRVRDHAIGSTASGPHRDELEFMLDGWPVKKIASQGQEKSFVVALRFAQYALVADTLNLKPLILLDDIFDRLDSSRVDAIIKLVAGSPLFGQIFITDTNRKHLDEIIASIGNAPSKIWEVRHGNFTEMISK